MDRTDFQNRLADLLESIFDDLKKSSKSIAESCVLPTQELIITINPVGDPTEEEIPSVTIEQTFLPNKDVLNSFYGKE